MKSKRFFYILIIIVTFPLCSCCNRIEAKNIHKTVYLDSDKSFLSQVKESRTRYVVQSEFDLKGEKVCIPKNSILEFRGGLLINGELQGKNTVIIAPAEQVFGRSISLVGNWGETEFFPEWFGANGDGICDDTEALQRAINIGSIVSLSKTYKVYHLSINKSLSIKGGCLKAFLDEYGNTRNILTSTGKYNLNLIGVSFDGSGYKLADRGTLEPMISIEGSKEIRFEKCSFHHHSQNSSLSDDVQWQKRLCYAVRILGAKNVVFKECEFHDNFTEQVAVGSNSSEQNRKPITKLAVKNCKSYNNHSSLALFLLFELKSASIQNNYFRDNGRTFFNLLTDNVTFQGNKLINTNSRAITSESEGNYYSVNNVIIKNNEIRNAKEGLINVGNKNIAIIDNVLENDFLTTTNDYLIKVGGVIVGNNAISEEARKAIPYLDNSFSACKKGENIIIRNNTIKGYARRGGVGLRVTLELTKDMVTKTAGSLQNVDISCNSLELSGDCYPIYFPDGYFADITIEKNIVLSNSSLSLVCMAPSSYSDIVENSVQGIRIIRNKVFYLSEEPVDCIFNSHCVNFSGVKIDDNEINVDLRMGLTNLEFK